MDVDSGNVIEIIGKNIKYYRELYSIKHGYKLSQEKLAELVNLSPTSIASIESSKPQCGISIYALCDISQVLGVPVSKFLELPPNERNEINDN